MSYNIKDAKTNLSSIIRLAQNGQPQVIRRHDRDVAVVISMEEWKKLGGKRESFVQFLQRSGLEEILPFLERPDGLPRDQCDQFRLK